MFALRNQDSDSLIGLSTNLLSEERNILKKEMLYNYNKMSN